MRSLDIVIPVYNESAVLPHLFAELDREFGGAALASCGVSSVRIILVDDGSTDDTAVRISSRILDGWNGVLLCLSRNFRHQAAVTAGPDFAQADPGAVMDPGLQEP